MPVLTPVMTPESFRSGSAAPISMPKNTVTAAMLIGWSVMGMPKMCVSWLSTRYDDTVRPVHSMPMPSSSVTGLDSELYNVALMAVRLMSPVASRNRFRSKSSIV